MSAARKGSTATFFAPEAAVAGAQLSLDEEAAHHARVRRLDVGHRVRVLDGAGTSGSGTIVRLAKAHMIVEVESAQTVEPPPPVHLLVPVADRDRMLTLAEKCAELGAASWRPVLWRRSRNVTPRGEGMTFHAKVRARMIAALEQSGGAWLPAIDEERTLEEVLGDAALPANRLLLDAQGEGLAPARLAWPLAIALGPEGGLEPGERDRLVASGWRPVRLASTILRFETAAVAALSLARALDPAAGR